MRWGQEPILGGVYVLSVTIIGGPNQEKIPSILPRGAQDLQALWNGVCWHFLSHFKAYHNIFR